ncbi:MAG: DUF2336 domain-containing protein [Robiginitomaculum sp.]|nr:DUF2336 domain-containing protein [Robiginitomaculum sp.]MDQ7077320.1 DUF2336 domain-containing protein [Robiginitomaculum sp.]
MTDRSKPLSRLLDLAHEKSSVRRRELLRDVTDLFFEDEKPHSDVLTHHFDEVLSTITAEMDVEIRKEIANRFAKSSQAPIGLIGKFANDDIEVAAPVLQHSPVLSDGELAKLVSDHGQAHMRAISSRPTLSETVTGAIVANGDTQTLVTLTQNQGAQFSRESMETLVNKSETETDLQSPLVNHQALPPDLLNDMYFFVEERLRKRIIERNQETPPEELERAFAMAKKRICGSTALPADYAEAVRYIEAQKLRKQVSPVLLAKLARNGDQTRFLLAFGELTGLDFETACRVWEPGKTEAVAIVCKASDLPRDLFATLVVLMCKDGSKDISDIQSLGQVYEDIPKAVAERTLRFWKMRKHAKATDAA